MFALSLYATHRLNTHTIFLSPLKTDTIADSLSMGFVEFLHLKKCFSQYIA